MHVVSSASHASQLPAALIHEMQPPRLEPLPS